SPGSSAARPIAISVEDVSKSFRLGAEPAKTLKDRLLTLGHQQGQVVDALSNVKFGVRQGECFGILGHNGSGKSTLLKVMAGTIRPTDGRVRVRGRLAALLELGAGFHPDLTGRENIYLNASILGFDRDHVDRIFANIVEFAELEDFIDLQVKFYSSGMTARLGFAVATNLEPDVLLVDEVLAVGDEAFQLKCMERVHRFRAMGRTMVIVSHGPELVRELCDRALVLERGRMLHVGDVGEAVEIYRAALHDLSHRSGPSRAALPPTGVTEATDDDVPPVELLEGRVLDVDPEVPFGPGQQVRIVVRYRLNQPVDFRVRLALRSDDNAVMMNRSTTDVLDEPLPDRLGEYELAFTIDDLPLLNGTYRFAFVAETPDAGHVWDRIIPPQGEFAVRGPDPAFGRVAVKLTGTLSPAGDLDLEPLGERPLEASEQLESGHQQDGGGHGRDGQVLQVPGGRP
ncbi:MAG: ABC transporter ATP-binding protein, partial [Actinomycetota bacterium]